MNLTDTQRDAYLAALLADHGLGDVPALRQAGVTGTAGELRRMLDADADLREDAWQARGWDVTPALSALAAVAVDTEHRAWNQGNERWLKIRGYNGPARIELTGADGGPLAFEDRSATLDDVARVLTATGALDGSRDDLGSVAAAEVPMAAPEPL